MPQAPPMECLHSRIAKLNYLWTSLGSPLDSTTVSQKLQYVYYELDRLIEYEELQRRLLCGDIEDIMASIEHSCGILGVSIENILTSDLCKEGLLDGHLAALSQLSHPTFARQKSLLELDSRLTHEIYRRRSHVKEWLQQIAAVAVELEEQTPFRPYQAYEDELSWGTVQSISCALRDLLQKQSVRRHDFEVSARAIHYYWTLLGLPPDTSDIIDRALDNLFAGLDRTTDFKLDTRPSRSLADDFTYYDHVKDNYLRSAAAVDVLRQKASDLEAIFNQRLQLYNRYVKSIRTIWDELKTPANQRFAIRPSLSSIYLDELHAEFDRLKTIVRNMAEEYIDKFREKLEDLWDKALLTQKERAEFIAKLHEKADTMDEVHLLVDEHIKYLQRVQPKARIVARLMKQRRELIQKMIDFEKTASDPKRLFQSSFQLNEEERWRKTCFPTLLMLDDSLLKAVQDFERVSGKPFIYDHRRYLDTLRDEIADRAATQTFFGFLNTDPKPAPPASTTARQDSASRTKTRSATLVSPISTKKGSTKTSSKTPSPTPPSRRSLTRAASKGDLGSARSSKSTCTQLLSNAKLMPPTPPADELSTRNEYINSTRKSRIPCATKTSNHSPTRHLSLSTRQWSTTTNDTVDTPSAERESPSMSPHIESPASAVSIC
ncbi:microtubule associated protein-domain-containing protein [Fennellomyces sp. T-0311]|nr:microtubule associated protein-domain-containing protein [Fennellomyces sp. T-0311]